MDPSSPDDPKSNKKSGFNTYQIDAKLAIAFQEDCENLLHKFKQQQIFTFSSFSKIWKENSFLAVFKGFENILMIKTFLENCFFIIKKFLVSHDLYIQTGAIYLLYGLYYKQPIKEWVKIRLTQTDVDKLNEIINTHKSFNCLDPIYIFCKMRMDNAFQYCALPQPMAMESGQSRRFDLGNEEVTVTLSKDNVLQKFKKLMEEDPDLVQLEETDDEYQRLSQKYKDKLFVFPSKIGDELKKAYSEIFNIQLDDEESGQDRIKEVKNKAVGNFNATYRGERKIWTALDLDTPSTSKTE